MVRLAWLAVLGKAITGSLGTVRLSRHFAARVHCCAGQLRRCECFPPFPITLTDSTSL